MTSHVHWACMCQYKQEADRLNNSSPPVYFCCCRIIKCRIQLLKDNAVSNAVIVFIIHAAFTARS